MGVVYKARQKSLDRLVALKLLAPERVNDPRFAERFSREAKALAALNHPNIVTIHDFGQAGGFYFLLMEFVDGVNLRQAMKAGRFRPEQALAIVPPVCEALQFAHEHGIAHRDIKPENLLLDKDGRVKIADFGIAKMLNATDVQDDVAESQTAGTPQYMAPEQKAHRTTDHRADIYSLGVVLYEMLTGELPASNLQPPSRRVQIDVRLDEIVLRALEIKPELRFQTAGEFRTQIETVAETSPGRSRFSRTAIVGALWIPFFFLSFLGMFTATLTVQDADNHGPTGWQYALMFTLIPLGFSAPFGTTILGWLAVSQINRSAGKLYGLWLAVFDGLLFPLLALDGLLWVLLRMVGISIPVDWILPFRDRALFPIPVLPGFVGLSLIVLIDIFIIRAVWRRVSRSAGTPASSGSEGVSPKNSRSRLVTATAAIAAACLLLGIVLVWIFASFTRGQSGGMLIMTVMPLKVVGRNVVVRVKIQDQSSPCELRVVLDGPENPGDPIQNGIPVMPMGLANSQFQGTFVTPRASYGNQPWFQVSGPMDVDIAFAFPTRELAMKAFENVLYSQPIDALSIVPRRHTLMEATETNGTRFTALLLASVPIREGDPKWVSINSVSHIWSGSSMDVTWEVLTSRPCAVVRRYNQSVTGLTLSPERDKRRLFKTTVRVFLYATGPNRVRIQQWVGDNQSYLEMDGDFDRMARELRDTAYLGSIKTEREWETELCRIGGLPMTVQVTDELAGSGTSRVPATQNQGSEATLDATSALPR